MESKAQSLTNFTPQIESLESEELAVRYQKHIKLKFFLAHYTGYAITFCNYNVLVVELTKAINDVELSLPDALNKIRSFMN